MATMDGPFAAWLSQAGVRESRLNPDQVGVLKAAYHFRESCGEDYYSTRILSHFLLHAQTGLKVAKIARLLKVSRPSASRQQGCSSKEAIQAAHHRMAGRPHGKLLPRYAGPIAEFILTHADASRYDILEFIERTWGVRVSTVALHHFCKKFGLDRATRAEATAPRPSATSAERTPAEPRPVETVPPSQPVPLPPPPFSRRGRNTRGRSC
jgi:transposase